MRLLAALLVFLVPFGARAAEGRFERMAALQETIVSMHESAGIPGVLTYDHDPAYWLDNIALGKLKVGFVIAGKTNWAWEAKDLKVRNIPSGEGIEATGTVGGVRFKIEAIPTAHGRETMRWEGSAVLKVTCSPASRIVLEYGGLARVRIHGFRPALPYRPDYLTKPDFLIDDRADATCTVTGNRAAFSAKDVPLKASATFSADKGVTLVAGQASVKGEIKGDVREVHVLVGFAESEARAAELASDDPVKTERECRDRFTTLTNSAWIKTGSRDLDACFKAALINLEYAWVRPYGWVEAVHHWGTLYSQQHNMGADWLGQQDRSREMMLTHASKLLNSGQVPQLDVYGRPRLDFGGWSQFYVWGVRHFWRMTGDKDFAAKIREPLGRVVDQTFTQHDPDGNDLLGFGQQIGNQEDYISTPEDGTSPTIAGIEMKRVQAEIALALGRTDEARKLTADAARIARALRATLWNGDLGRFIFYRDRLGVDHLDSQYHTYIWPVIFGLLDPLDSYTSMRHLHDTLTGEDGQIFCSNNFPNHVVATVGSQAGGQQQPWATLAWAKLGDGDKAAKPLEWIAKWVMNEANAGSWIEVAEDMPAYFTPPAGVYIQGVVEGIFGLTLNKPRGELTISPCLPPNWPKAEMHLPEYDMTIVQSSGRRVIRCKSKLPLKHLCRVAIPPASEINVTANGKPAKFTVEEGMARQFVCLTLPRATKSDVEITWQPIARNLEAPREVAPDTWTTIKAPNLSVDHVADPCGVLEESRIEKNAVRLHTRRDAASGATDYGEPGRRTLTRRTVFLHVITGRGAGYWEPVDFEIRPVPRFTQQPRLIVQDGKWVVLVQLQGVPGTTASAEFNGLRRELSIQASNSCPITLDDADLAAIHPGMNDLRITLADGRAVSSRFDGYPLFDADKAFADYAVARLKHIDLPSTMLSPDTDWRSFRWNSNYGHPPWWGLQPPLQGLDKETVLAPDCPGLTFANTGRKLIAVSRHLDRPSVTIPTEGEGRKVYLLVVPFLDNHDVFSPVGRVTVKCAGDVVFSRELRFPGDLDWWAPPGIVGGFATLGSGWSSSVSWGTPVSVMNVIEVDLKATRQVESVTVETIGRYPALGVVGVSVLGDPEPDAVAKLSERVRSIAATAPRSLFSFEDGTLKAWQTTGTAWGIADSRGDYWGRKGTGAYFANSMAGGESATGTITSPEFKIDGSALTFLVNGHGSKNYYALIDATTGAELLRAASPERTGLFVKIEWDVRPFKGRTVRFKAVDAETANGYAWIAFDEIRLAP